MSLRDCAKGHFEENQDGQRDRHVSHPRLGANGTEVSGHAEGLGLAPTPQSKSRKGPEREWTRDSVEEEEK